MQPQNAPEQCEVSQGAAPDSGWQSHPAPGAQGRAGRPWEGLGRELHCSESLISGPPPAIVPPGSFVFLEMSVSQADLSPGMGLGAAGSGSDSSTCP